MTISLPDLLKRKEAACGECDDVIIIPAEGADLIDINSGQVTSFTETKLYAYMFALCLHLENFSIDPTSLSKDLGLKPTR